MLEGWLMQKRQSFHHIIGKQGYEQAGQTGTETGFQF